MFPASISKRSSRLSRRDPTSPVRHLDPVIIACTIVLAIVGVVVVHSATRGAGPDYSNTYLFKQAGFVVIGFGVLTLFTVIDYQKLHDWAWVFYGITNLALLLVISPLGSRSNGAQAWFAVGPFQLQPAEFAKISLIGVLAFMLSEFRGDIDIRRTIALLAVVGFPVTLIMLQPDLGLALILTVIMMAMLLIGGIPTRYILVLTLVGVVGVVGALNSPVIKQYQQDRLLAFSNPEDRSNPAVYNIAQSRLAIASGQLTGQGLFQGAQTRLGTVPEQQTDFIFTAVAEQFGFVGSGLLLLLYALLCQRILRTARIARDQFGTLICVGVLAMFLFSIFENVGMAMGIMPVTGIPLLLLSAGGSSTITALAAIGLVLNVHMRRFR